MSDPQWPSLHVTKIVEEDGRKFRMPITSPVCDFCGHDSPAWDYDCHDFVIDNDLASANGWAACTPCSNMIEAEDWAGLRERAMIVPRTLGPALEAIAAHQVPLMHGGFRDNRYGERRPWG